MDGYLSEGSVNVGRINAKRGRYDPSSINLMQEGVSRGCKKIFDRILGEPQ